VTQLRFEFTYEKAVVRRPPATDAQIAGVEARFGGVLPADYRLFLQSINGGAPAALGARPPTNPHDDDPRRCEIDYPDDPAYSFEVECFYGLGPPDAYEVESYAAWPSEVLGRQVVTIAGNGCGDQLIFLTPGDAAVYHFIHDEDVPPVRIASSFTELLSVVQPAADP
jgi:SMI1 / KNR4 family (SUKH-1)